MKKLPMPFLVLFLLAGQPSFSQQAELPVSVSVRPGLSIPVGEDADVYEAGGGGTVTLSYGILPFLSAGLNTGYVYLPVKTLPAFASRTLSLTHLGLQAGTSWEAAKRLSLHAYAGGGWYYGFANEDREQSEDNPYLYGGVGASYKLIPSFSIGLDASYRNFSGLARDVMIHLAGILHIGAGGGGPVIPPNRDLKLLDMRLGGVFPVFYGYYDKNPLGVAVLSNTGGRPAENVKVTFHVRQFMDNPKLCLEIGRLDPGEKKQVPLYALFTDAVLDITEGTKVSASIVVRSESGGVSYANEYAEALSLYDRNAMTWDDTAKAASFVTAKDQDVLRFSKNVAGMVKDKVNKALNQNIVTAAAVFQALKEYGIRYEIDPSSAYQDFSKNTMMVDYLQFPYQTLDFRAGDCDDLSILLCALLESVGIETAFVTVPGHIFAAFSTGMSRDEARGFFNNSEEVIIVDEAAWLPVEATAVGEGFVRAWKIGAAQWKENRGKGRAEFVPVRKSWNTYNAVGYTRKQAPDIRVPEAGIFLPKFLDEMRRLTDTEIFAREKSIKAEIARTGGSPQSRNRLGVLYARFGMVDRAREEFETILKTGDYLPAYLNLGMIFLLGGESEKAREYYGRAERVSRDNGMVLLGLARACYELGNYGDSLAAYDRLKSVDSRLAGKYAYLELSGGAGTARASDAAGPRSAAEWEE